MAVSGFLSEDFRAELKALIKEALTEQLDAPTNHKEPDSDGLVDVKRAAEYLDMTTSWLYKHANELPFSRKVGGSRKFDKRAMKIWLERRRP